MTVWPVLLLGCSVAGVLVLTLHVLTLPGVGGVVAAILSISDITYLDLGPPVPQGASGDEKPPSITVTGDPAGSMPADTHLF